MNVLFLHRWVGVHEGGTETHVKNLMRYMVKAGHNVSLITRDGKALDDFDSRIMIYRVPKLPGESDFSYASMYDPRLYFYTFLFIVLIFTKFIRLKVIGKRRFDFISVHFLTEAKAARLIRRLFGIPYSFSLEGYTRAEAIEAKGANLIFACSSDIVEKCNKNFGYRPILKLHGVDFKVFNREKDTGLLRKKLGLENCFVFLTVCRLEPRKDLPTLLKAAKDLVGRIDSIRFLIVGEGISGDELKMLNQELGLKDKVTFTGRVSDGDLPLYYALADAFVLPTLYEGFGIVYAEAMAAKLPIISTNAGAVPEVVGEAGILVEPRNVKALAAAMEKIYSDRDLYTRLSNNSFGRARSHYNADNYLKIFEQSITGFLRS